MRIVYTAIFGDYDTLQEPAIVSPGVRYVCFSDKVIRNRVWSSIVTNPGHDSIRNARDIKVRLHKWLPGFTEALWIDANQQINCEVNKLFDLHYGNITLMKHPWRDCIYEEAKECIRLGKDKQEIINLQLREYFKEGLPERSGLAATGLMIRKNEPEINDFCEKWFEEIKKGSCRDQLSFNYVLWKSKITVNEIPFTILKENFTRCNHIK